MEKNSDSIPKFFCENCGKEVKRNASICPHCGRFFASVKCPACNYIGEESQFRDGCPRCGFAVHKHNRKEEFMQAKKKYSKSSRRYDEGLPWWVYVLALATFLIVVGIVLFH